METPKGWCLVPENPTDAQLAAAQDAWLRDPQRRTSTIYSAALAARPIVKDSLTAPTRHELQSQGKHPAPCARFCEANAFKVEARQLGGEIIKMREALLRLRRWGMGGSFHAGVVGDLQEWIDGGMVGDLPEYPDHLPPPR